MPVARRNFVDTRRVVVVTTPAKAPDGTEHHHLASIAENGSGMTTMDAGHCHRIRWLDFGPPMAADGEPADVPPHLHDIARRA